jgi:Chaperone required for the assembly of the mitochondrial F1-ATPase
MLRHPRRFYRTVALTAADDGHRITLDGRPARTPAGRLLVLPSAALAAAIAEEWEAQVETIDPESMPLTRLAFTAIDRICGQRPGIIDGLLAYAGSDVLCYRAESPRELVALEHATWQPILDWAAAQLGVRLVVGHGVAPVQQGDETIETLAAAVAACDDMALAGLASIAQTAGSLVIALAVVRGRIDAEAAFRAAFLDECYQAERWGCDPDAASRRDRLAAEIAAAASFVRLVREGRTGRTMS